MAVTDYSTTPGSNTAISGINIGENCSPANINNAIRQLMADVATALDDGTFLGGADFQPLEATLTALAAVTTAANKLIYATASDTFATTDLSAFGRTLIDDANAAAARTTLGVFDVSASSLANPGYITFSNGFKVQWGSGSIAANTTTSITYPSAFASFGVCVVSGGPSSTSAEGDIHVTAASGLSSQSLLNSAGSTGYYSYVAVGV